MDVVTPIRAQLIEIGDLEVKRSAFIHFATEQDCRDAAKGRPITLTWDRVDDLPSSNPGETK